MLFFSYVQQYMCKIHICLEQTIWLESIVQIGWNQVCKRVQYVLNFCHHISIPTKSCVELQCARRWCFVLSKFAFQLCVIESNNQFFIKFVYMDSEITKLVKSLIIYILCINVQGSGSCTLASLVRWRYASVPT